MARSALVKFAVSLFIAIFIAMMEETGTKLLYSPFNLPAAYDGVRAPVARANHSGTHQVLFLSIFLMIPMFPLAILSCFPATRFLQANRFTNPVYMALVFVLIAFLINYTVFILSPFDNDIVIHTALITALCFWLLYMLPWVQKENLKPFALFKSQRTAAKAKR